MVAAENVYGDIASQIGGADVGVTSILTSPTADPHLFEPKARTGLAVADADVVIENGAGYDAFVDKLVSSTGTKARVVSIERAVGAGGSNPHLWYDLPKARTIAGAIERALVAVDPKHELDYRAGLRRFDRSLDTIDSNLQQTRTTFAGAPVAATEPLAGLLLQAVGLHDVTPPAFSRAIEDGTAPAPDAVAAMRTLIDRRQVRVLVYNLQAQSPLTLSLRIDANRHAVPVVAFTETLPKGFTYQEWQLAQLQELESALAQ